MINISPIYATMIVQKLALYCSSYYGNDLYYLKEVTILMVNLFGEETLIEMLKKDESNNKKVTKKMGEEWKNSNGMKKKLIRISEILEKVNKSYSILNDKTIKKEERESIKFKEFSRLCTKLPYIENEFYALFVFMIQNSSIQQMNISPQFLKVLDKGNSFGGVNKPTIKSDK